MARPSRRESTELVTFDEEAKERDKPATQPLLRKNSWLICVNE
jgi:hypothetical protein